MYSNWSVFAGLVAAAIFIWLGVLSFFVWKQGNFLKSLFPKSGERDIRKKFAEVLSCIKEFKGDLGKITKNLADLAGDSKLHVQRVALLRYNPYGDTGGNLSFSAVLLDWEGNGIIVTSLHSRSGTRVFAKSIDQGKAGKNLSEEEQEALDMAMRKK
ncbi:DUF4446 family protein [Candidatus Daviesbacteria bacterium]|nr:DUF4446 family protein [Candidatus Daviesbacteria bacterium]